MPQPPKVEEPPLGNSIILGYTDDDPNYPIIGVRRDPNAGSGMNVPSIYSVHPNTARYPNHVFVGVNEESPDLRNYWIYKILPGPLVSSRAVIAGGLIELTTKQEVRDTSTPGSGSGIHGDEMTGKTVAVGVRTQTLYTNPDGTTASAPIFLKTQFIPELGVWQSDFQQEQDSPGSPPAIDSTYGTGGVISGGAVTVISVDSIGQSGGAVSLITVAASRGQRALAHGIMGANNATVVAGGTGWVTGETITISGGAGTVSVLAVATVGLASFTINVNGGPLTAGETLAMSGGTHSVAAVLTVSSLQLYALSVNSGGTGYAVNDLVTLVGGTGTAAIIRVTAVSSGAITGFNFTGSGASPGIYTGSTPSTFTSTGGTGTGATFKFPLYSLHAATITTAGVYTVSATTLTHAASGLVINATWTILSVSVSTAGALTALPAAGMNTANVAAPGAGYQPLDTISLAGGTGTEPVVLVESVTGTQSSGPVASVSVVTPGSLTALPTSTASDGLVSYANFTQDTTIARDSVGTATVNTSTDVVTVTSHGMSVGQQVAFDSTGSNPGGIAKNRAYYVLTTPDGDTLTLSKTKGGSTLNITTSGSGTITMYKQSSATAGNGGGAQFASTDFNVDITGLTGSGSGTGAELIIYYALASVVVDQAGTLYSSAPTATSTTNDTLITFVSSITETATSGIVVGSSIENQTASDKVIAKWTTLPMPPTQGWAITEPFVQPGLFTTAGGFVHSPPWPGIEYTNIPPLSSEFPAMLYRLYQLYPFLQSQLYTTFSITTPGAASAIFRIRDRTIHGQILYVSTDGTYAESFPASTVQGQYGQTYCTRCSQRRVAGNIWVMEPVFVNAR